jgi:hypothetical protein
VTRYRRNAAVSETTLGEETFLVDAQGREVYYLDPVTSGLWRLLAEPQTLESCRVVFEAAFPEAPAERIAQDLARVLAELEASGLVLRIP